jgi:hypothetical protein
MRVFIKNNPGTIIKLQRARNSVKIGWRFPEPFVRAQPKINNLYSIQGL